MSRGDRTNRGLGHRLRKARLESGRTQRQVSESIGVDPNTVYGYESNRINPSGPALRSLASLYGKSVDWFFSDDEDATAVLVNPGNEISESPPQLEAQEPNGPLDQIQAGIARLEAFLQAQTPPQGDADRSAGYDINRLNPSDRSPVEVLEVASAAGVGAEVFDETPVGLLWFRNDWLQSHSIDPTQSHIISVQGESMEPTLPDGCSILVDRQRREPHEDRIYVMRTDDGLVVKRLGVDERGRWELLSDNPNWEPTGMSFGTEIIGEVRWYCATL